MEDTKSKEKEEIVLSVHCSYLQRRVILYKKTWQHYIIPNHPEVKNRLKLIEQILSKDEPDNFKYRKIRDRNEIAILKKCPHLQPWYDYIKIGIKLINDKRAVIATAHGQNNLPKRDVEEIT